MIEIRKAEAIGYGDYEPTELEGVFIDKVTRKVAICKETANGEPFCIVVSAVNFSDFETFRPYLVQ